jgi:HEAT repeat protein
MGLLVPLPAAHAQLPACLNPVQDLRLVLAAPISDTGPQSTELELRRQNLQRCAASLHRVPDLRDALQLNQWRDEDPDPAVAAIDLAARSELADRFELTLRAVLLNGDNATRLGAVNLIGELAGNLRAARSGMLRDFGHHLAGLVRGVDMPLRWSAARALGRIRPDPAVAIPALSELFEVEDPLLRQAAAAGLADLVEMAAQGIRTPGKETDLTRAEAVQIGGAVVPVACGGLADSDDGVRRLSITILEETALLLGKLVSEQRPGPDNPAELEEYRRSVSKGRGDVAALVSGLSDQIPGLTQAMSDSDPDIRVMAHETLETLTENVKRWRQQSPLRSGSALAVYSSDAEAPGSEAAIKLVAAKESGGSVNAHFQDRLGSTIPALVPGLKDPDVRVRRASIDSLEMLGNEAEAAVPGLIGVLMDPDPFVRWSAARVLGKIGQAQAELVASGLIPLLSDPDLDVRLTVAESLRKLGPAAREAVPALTQVMRAGDAEIRVAAIASLEGLGPAGEPALPTLIEALRDPDPRVRKAAAGLLGKLGPKAETAREALRQRLSDEDSEVRKAASDALLEIVPPGQGLPKQAQIIPIVPRSATSPVNETVRSSRPEGRPREASPVVPVKTSGLVSTAAWQPDPTQPILQAVDWQPVRVRQTKAGAELPYPSGSPNGQERRTETSALTESPAPAATPPLLPAPSIHDAGILSDSPIPAPPLPWPPAPMGSSRPRVIALTW